MTQSRTRSLRDAGMPATTFCLSLIVVTLLLSQTPCRGQGSSFRSRMEVQGEARLDWLYALLGRSFAEPPEGVLRDSLTR